MTGRFFKKFQKQAYAQNKTAMAVTLKNKSDIFKNSQKEGHSSVRHFDQF